MMEQSEFIRLHGDKKVKFKSYYKYIFTFVNDEEELVVSVGGNHEDIYKMNVHVDTEYLVSELEPIGATLHGISLGYWY